jgi:hypothetical protein
MDFKPINTQEEFEAAVKDKYGDVEDLQGQITTLTGERDGHAKTIADLQGQIAGYKNAELRSRIAKELGIPENMASRIGGTDEKSMREDAKALQANLKSFMGADPDYKNDKGGKGGENGDLLSMLRSMKGE